MPNEERPEQKAVTSAVAAGLAAMFHQDVHPSVVVVVALVGGDAYVNGGVNLAIMTDRSCTTIKAKVLETFKAACGEALPPQGRAQA
jgi:hypothetical protein